MSNVQANPAVTFSMTITEVLPLRLLVPNIIAQLVAAVFATMTAQIIRQDLRKGFTSMAKNLSARLRDSESECGH